MGRSILLNGYVSRLKEVGFIQLGSVQSIFNCPFDIVFKKKTQDTIKVERVVTS